MTDARLPLSPAEPAPSAPAARQALLAAFAKLALSRRYRDFGVAAIVRSANVARSTYYYHFAGKDDLLLHNLRPLITALAHAPFTPEPSPDLESWIAHIWEQRRIAGQLLTGAAGRKIEAALAASLKETFAAEVPTAHDRHRHPLMAEQIAGASLALLKAWIAHRVTATPLDIAQTLWSGARAIVASGGARI